MRVTAIVLLALAVCSAANLLHAEESDAGEMMMDDFSAAASPSYPFVSSAADSEGDDDLNLDVEQGNDDGDVQVPTDEDLDNDLVEDDLDLQYDDDENGWPAVVSLLEDGVSCASTEEDERRSSASCKRVRSIRRRCRPCRDLKTCHCKALHVMGKLMRLKGKWRITRMLKRIRELGARYHAMLDKVRRVSARDMEPRRLVRSFDKFIWTPTPEKEVPTVTTPSDVAKALPPRREHDWQKQWVKWGWLSPKHSDPQPQQEEAEGDNGSKAAKQDDSKPRIVRHSCPGGAVIRRQSVGGQHVSVFKSTSLGGNFFNDVDWSICFRAALDCRQVNSRWQVVFGGQCGQPLVGFVGGQWVFARQCGGAPSIAFGEGRCGHSQDVSVIKKGQKLCFIIDGLQTKCQDIDSKFTPYAAHTEYAIGAGFHDGKEMFRGVIEWIRIGSALVPENKNAAIAAAQQKVDDKKENPNCPAIKDAAKLQKKDFVSDSILQFESVAGYNCTTVVSGSCDQGKFISNVYGYAGAHFDPKTTNMATQWASSPYFTATHLPGEDDGTEAFGSKPIAITFSRVVTRVGMVLVGPKGTVKIQTFDSQNCKLSETSVDIDEGRHPSSNFVGLGGLGKIHKVVLSGANVAIDDVQFGNDDQSKLKPVKRLELNQFNGDMRVEFDSVAGKDCTTRNDTCLEGTQVSDVYLKSGVVFGEGVKNLFSPWATSNQFAASTGPISSYSNRPLIAYFTRPMKRVGFSLLGVGGKVDVQLFDTTDVMIGATTVEYAQGRGQFAGFGSSSGIGRVAIIGNGFAIDDLTFSAHHQTPVLDKDVVQDIGGVKAWFISTEGVTEKNGSVSVWADRSPYHFDLTQGDSEKQPKLKKSGLNGKPVVSFDGVDDLLKNEAFDSCKHKIAVFAVFKLATFEAQTGYPWSIGDHNPGFIAQESEGSHSVFDVAFGHGNDRRFEIMSADRFRVMTYAGASKNDLLVWAEGKPAKMEPLSCCHGPAEFANPAIPCFKRIALGGLDFAVDHAVQNTKVEWAELIVFEKELSRLQQEEVEEYLMKKYNIAPPQGITTCATIRKQNATAASDFYDLTMSDGEKIKAYCDMKTDGGGWTRIQIIDEKLSKKGTLGSAANLHDVIHASSKVFRFSDNADGAGEHNMYIKDPAPLMGQNPASAHTWTSAADKIGCKMTNAAEYKYTTAKEVSCDKTIVGHHTCGSANGWVLWFRGNTVNFDGEHPCATEKGKGGPPLRYLFVR